LKLDGGSLGGYRGFRGEGEGVFITGEEEGVFSSQRHRGARRATEDGNYHCMEELRAPRDVRHGGMSFPKKL
jgi:hypothetical protein